MFQIFFEDAIREYTTVKRLTRLLDRIYLNKKIELGRLKLKIRRLKAVEERIDPVMDLVDYDCGENKFENVEREFKDVEELCQIIRNASEKSKERRRELEEIISSINKRSIWSKEDWIILIMFLKNLIKLPVHSNDGPTQSWL